MAEAQLENFFVARQPILDPNGKIEAYELLFRNTPTGIKGTINPKQATAQVLTQALTTLGITQLTGSAKAFVNFDRTLLLDHVFEPLDPKVFVIEVLEDVLADAELTGAVDALKSAGFEIALDDFIMSEEALDRAGNLFPYASYVKLDLKGNSKEQISDAACFFHGTGITMLAEKVEDKAQFLACKALGCRLFQGYFFAKPEIVSGKALDPSMHGVIRLLKLLEGDPNLSDIEAAFKSHPEITFGLLKLVNTARFGVSRTISSVGQALSLTGIKTLKQWLILLLYANGSAGGKTMPALLDHAMHRAHTMESIARKVSPRSELHDQAFLVGLFSLMDALCGVETRVVVREFMLCSEIERALLVREGLLGTILQIVIALESGNFELAGRLGEKLNLNSENAHSSLLESWAFHEAGAI